MVDIQSPTVENRRGKTEEERQKPQLQNIMACPLLCAAITMKTTTQFWVIVNFEYKHFAR